MKRKDYRKPTIKVVKLQNQCQILAGSEGAKFSRRSYGVANSGVDEEELSDGTWEWN